MTFVAVSIVSMLIMLGILVLVHEFGHFAVAKFFGVRVETFSIGFGKRLFGFRHGETDYRISLLPLGGYVKMAGEMSPEKATGDPAEYTSKPRWQRILILCAGPAANFILALLLLTVVYMGHNEVPNYITKPAVVDYVRPGSNAAVAGLQSGDKIVGFNGIQDPTWNTLSVRSMLNLGRSVPMEVERNGQREKLYLPLPSESNPENDTFRAPEGEIVPFRVAGFTTKVQTEPLKVALVSPGMPGAKAGLKTGDEIESIDGVPMHSLASLVLFLQQSGDKPATLGVMRDGKPVSLSIRPKKVVNPEGKPTYKIGVAVAFPPSHLENLSLPAAFSKSVQDNLKATTLVGDILQRLVSAQMSIRTLSGPVGIARMTGHVAALPGWTPMMAWTANISLQLGLLNLLPIPILDGGTILFLIIESIMRHDLNEQFKERVFQMAFVFLILITVIILFSDLAKIPAISRIKM